MWSLRYILLKISVLVVFAGSVTLIFGLVIRW